MTTIKLANEKLKELENKSKKCDSHTASVALGLGRFIEMAFSEKQINEDEMTKMFDKADLLTTRFRHDCNCRKMKKHI